MTFSSCLTEQSPTLVLDSSIIINLLATGHAEAILQALPGLTCVTETVIGEIKGGAENGHGESAKLVELIDSGKLDVVALDNEALESFISIVSGSTSDSLGDGEAATLAFAYRNGLVAAIDEKKARRVAGESFGSLTIATTVDILAYAPVGQVLGKERLSKTVLDALRLARMQVWEPHFDWVVAQIGSANVPLCPSLRRLAKRVRVTTAQ
jgi:predicted nucleic acid-binding protein